MKPTVNTTVICAVWHADPDRVALVRAHRANLAAQSVPVDVVYVFDNGDTVPGGLDARTFVAGEPLTIYEAWNIALAAVRTPLVINLNLDDRLCTDAVEQMERVIESESASLVGGDWRMCHSQEDTDAVGPCVPADQVPLLPAWPPAAGLQTRLGSGTGERGTFGPAVMWRMAVHMKIPRYPYRTDTGDAIRSVADSVFWHLMQTREMVRTRMPMIVGHCFSHPAQQAEFRYGDELAWLQGRKISLL